MSEMVHVGLEPKQGRSIAILKADELELDSLRCHSIVTIAVGHLPGKAAKYPFPPRRPVRQRW